MRSQSVKRNGTKGGRNRREGKVKEKRRDEKRSDGPFFHVARAYKRCSSQDDNANEVNALILATTTLLLC